MKTKKQKPPARLPLSDIIRDPALAVRLVNDAVAEDYAEHLGELPAVIVWEILGHYYLADGWHRYRAHELAGATDIKAIVMSGTLEQAKLFVANCDIRVGVRRTREAKRAAVLLVLGTEKGSGWGDREVARHCGVSHTFVSLVKARLAAGNVANQDPDNDAMDEDSDRPLDCIRGNVAIEPVDKSGDVATAVVERADSEVSAATGKTAQNSHEYATAAGDIHHEGELELDEKDDEHRAANAGNGPTVSEVIDQISALTAACEDAIERRRILNRLGNVILGMLEELGPFEEEPNDEDDYLGLTSA